LLGYRITQPIGGVFPAQNHLVSLAMGFAHVKLSKLGTRRSVLIKECVRIFLALFPVSGSLVSLTIRLLVGSMRNGHQK